MMTTSNCAPELYSGALFMQKGSEIMGRPRKITSVKQLEEAWEAYKDECENQLVLTHDFSSKNSEFVSKELKRSVTYTVEGFCVFIGLARSKFYETYADDKRYRDTVTRMKEECELDARKKFELQVIPSQLAGLWMSNYGYTTKTDTNVTGGVPVVIHELLHLMVKSSVAQNKTNRDTIQLNFLQRACKVA